MKYNCSMTSVSRHNTKPYVVRSLYFSLKLCQPESHTKHVSANSLCLTNIALSTKQVTKLICLPDKTKVQHLCLLNQLGKIQQNIKVFLSNNICLLCQICQQVRFVKV